MARINLLTIHWTTSYGGVMQTYATCKLLESIGHEVTIINLVPNYIQRRQKSFINFLNLYVINIFQFLLFRKRYFPKMTKMMSSIEDNNLLPKADYTIVGSDQVWNPSITKDNARSYFLDFADGTKKISLSSSFGTINPEINLKELENYALEQLSSFEAISVRENTGVYFLKEHGIKKNVQQIVDPTLALGDFSDLIKNKKRIKEIYKFIFSENKKQLDLISHISNSLNLPVHKVSFLERKIHSSPRDWLSNFYRYDCIVTNSFHGLAFALIFRKNFFVVHSANPNQFTRLQSLLELLGLQNRYITSVEEVNSVLNEKIDYDHVYAILQKEKGCFLNFVTTYIE